MTSPALAKDVRGKGRHYQHPLTGELVPSVTNILGAAVNKPALPRWSAKVVAEQAAKMKRSLPNLDDAEIVDMLKGAPWRSSTRAANRGTTVHAYLESKMQGWELPEVDGEAARFRQAADAWLDEWRPEVIGTELTVFGDGYAGTGDLWCRRDGKVCLVDFKTSKDIYPEAALQLAALAWAGTAANGEPAEMVDEAWVVRIGERGFDAKRVADLEYNFQAFKACLAVWEWVNGDKVYA